MKIIKIIGLVILTFIVALTLTIAVWLIGPNTSHVDPSLKLEIWEAVNDGMHNSNTDMAFFNNYFYLVHASSPYHFATPECKLIVWRSKDCKQWEKLSTIQIPGEDIRDPKFLPIGNKLILFVLKSIEFTAEPYSTAYLISTDGKQWSTLQEIAHKGWLFWRPKTPDGKTWYAPAYWHQHGKAMLFKSHDGINWQPVSVIYEGDRCDETDIEFLPDTTMISTQRLEYSDSILGDSRASTGIHTAKAPYTHWTGTEDYSTRLDGPALFSYKGNVYAIGRRNPYTPGLLNKYGSILAKKRTSLWLVTPQKLVWLSDVPSAGDTSYAGYVIRGNTLYFSYYTSDIHHDYPWILGMIKESSIMIGKLNLDLLEKLALSKL
ncbi:MAG: hypothetical protein N3F66_13430 [Spirochaetes bacterium]|nr:hypothetical protein [Spirochaetota bacterium]